MDPGAGVRAGADTAVSGERVDAIAREILARDEFRSANERSGVDAQLIGELFESLLGAIQAFVGDLRANHPALFVVILVVGTLILAAAIWFGARGAARRTYGGAEAGGELPEVLRGDPAKLELEAAEHARAGRWLDAVRLLFRATIIAQAIREGTLERLRDAHAFRRARTYRELVGEFARSAGAREKMLELATRIELGLYAGAELGPKDWENAQALARERAR